MNKRKAPKENGQQGESQNAVKDPAPKEKGKKVQKPSEDAKKKAASVVKKQKAERSINKNKDMWDKMFSKDSDNARPGTDEKTSDATLTTPSQQMDTSSDAAKTVCSVEVVELVPTPVPKGVIVQATKRTHNSPASSSVAWNVFIRVKGDDSLKDYAVCRECGVLRKCAGGSTSGLLKHIQQEHPHSAKQKHLLVKKVEVPLTQGKRSSDWQKEMSVEFALSLAVDMRPLSSGEGEGAKRFFGKLCSEFSPPSHHTVLNHLTACKLIIDKKVGD